MSRMSVIRGLGRSATGVTAPLRRRSGLRRWLLALLLWPVLAGAHSAPYSYLILLLDEQSTHGSLVIHVYDVAHEVGVTDPAMLLNREEAQHHETQLRQLVESRMHIGFDGQAVQPVWQPIEVLPDRQSLRLQFDLTPLRPAAVDFDMQLFPYDPMHQTFIEVYEGGSLRLQAILDAAHASARYYSGSLQGRWAVIKTFVQSGVHHILIGPDHILFLMGLLLLGGTIWRLASIVTAFTLGHSVTLSLAALGLVRLSPAVVEPAIALSIVVVGADNLLVQLKRGTGAGSLADAASSARDLRPWFAGLFGLIHGFGFASVLMEFGLPRDALGWSLAAFNIGVELGQLVIVLPTATLLWWLWRRSPPTAARTVLLGSVTVVLAGAFWFVQRVWFTPA